jgi:hypothetical protein
VDRLAGCSFGKGRGVMVDAVFRHRDSEKKGSSQAGTTLSVPGNVTSSETRLRLDARWKPGPRLQAGTRVDLCRVNSGTPGTVEGGLMAVGDLGAEPVRGLKFRFRVLFFATDSYAARLYEMEADLPGTLTNAAVYGRGTRWYLLLIWSASDTFRLSGRFARTVFAGRKTIGSGPEEIPGPIEERAGLQIDVEF